MSTRSDPGPVLDALRVPPPPGSIYELALTHRSYAFENPDPLPHNERLEFLGDAVLGVMVTDLIYRRYEQLAEGEMARLRASVVNTLALADLARWLGLGAHIRLGKGEEASGGRDKSSLLADTLEALIGAAYLDQGPAPVSDVLVPLFAAGLDDVVAAGGGYDAKTVLQEVAVRHLGQRPCYKLASSGPDHDKRFTAHAYLDERLFGVGSGKSKKEAERNAARVALGRLEAEPDAITPGDPGARAS